MWTKLMNQKWVTEYPEKEERSIRNYLITVPVTWPK